MSAAVAAAAAVGASYATARSDAPIPRFDYTSTPQLDYAPALIYNPLAWLDNSTRWVTSKVTEIGERQRRESVFPKETEIARQRRMAAAKINEIERKGLSGILYKWINYLKGWKPRWFVLRDGVLSYYKIDGRDQINVSTGRTEQSSVVIGRESARFISKNKFLNSQPGPSPKPLGEIHLKVSLIEVSRSDDTKFTIFTGTKMLHLRAGCCEDRGAWVGPLKSIKSMFPRMELVSSPVTTTVVSTEKLRQRLVEEGLKEAAIVDVEQIVKNEFIVIQNQQLQIDGFNKRFIS